MTAQSLWISDSCITTQRFGRFVNCCKKRLRHGYLYCCRRHKIRCLSGGYIVPKWEENGRCLSERSLLSFTAPTMMVRNSLETVPFQNTGTPRFLTAAIDKAEMLLCAYSSLALNADWRHVNVVNPMHLVSNLN